jgi:hypothetical protein
LKSLSSSLGYPSGSSESFGQKSMLAIVSASLH